MKITFCLLLALSLRADIEVEKQAEPLVPESQKNQILIPTAGRTPISVSFGNNVHSMNVDGHKIEALPSNRRLNRRAFNNRRRNLDGEDGTTGYTGSGDGEGDGSAATGDGSGQTTFSESGTIEDGTTTETGEVEDQTGAYTGEPNVDGSDGFGEPEGFTDAGTDAGNPDGGDVPDDGSAGQFTEGDFGPIDEATGTDGGDEGAEGANYEDYGSAQCPPDNDTIVQVLESYFGSDSQSLNQEASFIDQDISYLQSLQMTPDGGSVYLPVETVHLLLDKLLDLRDFKDSFGCSPAGGADEDDGSGQCSYLVHDQSAEGLPEGQEIIPEDEEPIPEGGERRRHLFVRRNVRGAMHHKVIRAAIRRHVLRRKAAGVHGGNPLRPRFRVVQGPLQRHQVIRRNARIQRVVNRPQLRRKLTGRPFVVHRPTAQIVRHFNPLIRRPVMRGMRVIPQRHLLKV